MPRESSHTVRRGARDGELGGDHIQSTSLEEDAIAIDRNADRNAPERNMRVNEQIRISPVRVINNEGTMLGVMPTGKALELARESGLDLVEVASGERPPVCKIMDYGKFKYQQKKKTHKQKQHQVHIKEIRVRPKTGGHDIEVKVKRAREFLEEKDKVLVKVLFRGRELAHIDEGRRVMNSVLQMLDDVCKLEKPPAMEGKQMTAILAPRATAGDAASASAPTPQPPPPRASAPPAAAAQHPLPPRAPAPPSGPSPRPQPQPLPQHAHSHSAPNPGPRPPLSPPASSSSPASAPTRGPQ